MVNIFIWFNYNREGGDDPVIANAQPVERLPQVNGLPGKWLFSKLAHSFHRTPGVVAWDPGKFFLDTRM